MVINLENEKYSAKIDQNGAELISLYDKIKKIEYIWQRDKEIWANSAPILFPIVGRLKEGKYFYEGREYNMNIHGFAKDSFFSLVDQGENKITLNLTDTAETKKQYPFPFSLDINFSLIKEGINVSYTVKNYGKEDMYFSIGSHPGLNLPLDNCSIEDYYIEFDKNEKLHRYKIENGLLSQKSEIINGPNISLTKTIFNEDALIFKKITSHQIRLKNYRTGYNVAIDNGGAPSLGIWAKPNASYVCIEPWWGYDEDETATGNLKEKKGVVKLHSNESFSTYYKLQVEE